MKKDRKEKEEKKKKKKKKKKTILIKLLILMIIVILYSFLIGPKGIYVKEYGIKTNKISNKMHGIKILQFSDIHYGSTIKEKELNRLILKINSTKPDVVIFTGDLISSKYKITDEDKNYITTKLSAINAEIGMYYVLGDQDTNITTEILNASGFKNLADESEFVYKDNKPMVITSKEHIIDHKEDKDTFKLVAIHNPNDLSKIIEYNPDMVIAGHTLNGQINIYKLKELFINSKYISEYQKINNTRLYINRGLGTKKVNARLFNHPTINLYRIMKSSNY